MNKLSAELVHPESNGVSGCEAGSTSTQVVGIGGDENPQHDCVEQCETKDGRHQSSFRVAIPRSGNDEDHAHNPGSRDHVHDHARDSLAQRALPGIERERERERRRDEIAIALIARPYACAISTETLAGKWSEMLV